MSGYSDPNQGHSNDFNLGPVPYEPTQPAPQYIDPYATIGYTPSPDPSSTYGQPTYAQTYDEVYPAGSGYSVYDPKLYPGNPGQPGQYPLVPSGAGTMMAGQIVSTAFGNFTVSPKSKMAAGLLGIFLGSFGVGQFYRGNVGMGLLQLMVFLFTCGVGGLWGFIEGIVVLVAQPGSSSSLDSMGRVMT